MRKDSLKDTTQGEKTPPNCVTAASKLPDQRRTHTTLPPHSIGHHTHHNTHTRTNVRESTELQTQAATSYILLLASKRTVNCTAVHGEAT